MLDQLKGWSEYSEICIDGVNGCGKSSLIKRMNRRNLKINDIQPSITCGPEYNYQPLRSIEYLCMQQSIYCHFSVWDRCAYSNLIFYYVHFLMYEYRDGVIPQDFDSVLDKLNRLAIQTNLLQTINLMRSIKDIPILFLINSNIDVTACALLQRSGLNDIWNSKEYNYQMAQCHAYKYFAKILNAPLFDVVDFLVANYNISEMQESIIKCVDVSPSKVLKLQRPTMPDVHSSNKVSTI